jgi:hypothetical protein
MDFALVRVGNFGNDSVTAAGLLLLTFAASTKKVDGYYLSHGQNSGGASVCVNHWTWNQDQVAAPTTTKKPWN